MTQKHTIVTSYGSLAVEESAGHGLPVLMIHGNSSCREIFRHQLHGRLAERHRLIGFDLPGHGHSSDAPDPTHTYTRPGLADATLELLEKLHVREAVVLGFALGGHIGMEMMQRFAGMRGLMIVGSPPVPRQGIAQGFGDAPLNGLASKEKLSGNDITNFAKMITANPPAPFLIEAITRADGRFRKRLFEAALAGEGVDQRALVERSRIALAVVNGGEDKVVNLDYFDTVHYANLWEGRCHRLPKLGHAPFLESPGEFNPIFERFVYDMDALGRPN